MSSGSSAGGSSSSGSSMTPRRRVEFLRPHNLTLTLTRDVEQLYRRIRQPRTQLNSQLNTGGSHTDRNGGAHLQANTMLNNRYRVIRLLGDGTCSRVYEAEDTFCHRTPCSRVALKVLGSPHSHVGDSEWHALTAIHARAAASGRKSHVARVKGRFVHQSSPTHPTHVCLALELLGQDLLQTVRQQGPLSLPLIRRIALQLTLSLAELAALGLLHADLKPENVLFTQAAGSENEERDVVLVDLGNACSPADAARAFRPGNAQSLFYRAPEVNPGIFGCSGL